jgi:hypothetical protein
MKKLVDKIFRRVANHCGASCLKEHTDKIGPFDVNFIGTITISR